MADQIQEIITERDIEGHTWSDDDDTSLHLDDGIFEGWDPIGDYDEELNPTIVSDYLSNSSDQNVVKPRGHRDDVSAGLLLSLVLSDANPASWGNESGLTTESDVEESTNPETEETTIAPVSPLPYSPATSTGSLRLDNNKLVIATFPPDSHPKLPYHSASWRHGGVVVSPGPEEGEEEAVPPPHPLSWRVTPPGVASKKPSVTPPPPPPPVQAVVTPPRTTKRKRAPRKIRTPRKPEPKTKHYVNKTSLDVLLGRGGCSNHHSGNSGYRERILKLQPVYKKLERHEKTQFSQAMVDWVKNRGGRFLKRDGKTRWYIATDQMARLKVSQALREDHSEAGKRAKKEKQARAARVREAKLARGTMAR